MKAQESGATLSDHILGFDAAGNIGQVAASLPGASTLSGTTTYQHDDKLQLLSEQSTRSGGYGYSNAYDAAGNPTSFKGAAQTYNPNKRNKVNLYDGDRNPAAYPGKTLAFDVDNRATAFESLRQGIRAIALAPGSGHQQEWNTLCIVEYIQRWISMEAGL